jgi:predicted RNase H-like nuclease
MALVAGIDGCPAGWLRIERDGDSINVGVSIYPTALELFLDAARFAAIAIDIPIGLPEASPRSCDSLARAFIQPRGPSVFPAPVRAALETKDYKEACARSIAASGKSLSRQAFAILPKIREVDAFLRTAAPDFRTLIREVHPEVCFRTWKGLPIAESKKSGIGFNLRLQLVESYLPGQFEVVRNSVPRRAAGDDDILDAFAALWTAERIERGIAISFPAGPAPIDGVGLPMAILA